MAQRLGLPLPVLAIAALFGAALVLVVISALVPRRVATYSPRMVTATSPGVEDTVTIDARDPDHWQFFAVDRGVLPPPDTTGWDLGIRRFDVITSGAALRLQAGAPGFDAMTVAPETGYLATRFDRDTVNPALAHWYRYDFFSHLLRPGERAFLLRTRSGRYVKLQFLSYYCPGPAAGCLTFRYVASLAPHNPRFR